MAGGTGSFQAGTQLPGFLLDILAFKTGAVVTIPVNATAVVYSNAFILRRGCTYGWEMKATSSGVVALTIELEQANQPPTTEGAADDAFSIPIGKTGSNGMFPTGGIIAVNTHYYTAYSPVATVLGRLKITGGASNDASTILALARLYEIKTI